MELAERFSYNPSIADPKKLELAAKDGWRKFRKRETYAKARELILKEVKTDANGNPISKRFVRMPAQTEAPDGLELYGVSENVQTGGGWNLWRRPADKGIGREDFKAIAAEMAAMPAKTVKNWKPAEKTVGHVQIIALGDIHIGLDNTKDAIFSNLEWTPEELAKRTEILMAHADETAAKIYLVFGGDITDGLDESTARRGHRLPQNLDNKQQLRTATKWAFEIVDGICQATDAQVEIIWLCESNHGPMLDFATGLALETIAPQRWGGQVAVTLQEAFIAPYAINGRSFLFTHGYDSKHMRNGWPRYLQPQHQQFVERVIEHHYCTEPVLVRFDRHQYHDIGHNSFRDLLCPAFSNPSAWVQINFAANSRGGFLKIQLGRDGRISPVLVEF